jgi:hypothetical protein
MTRGGTEWRAKSPDSRIVGNSEVATWKMALALNSLS